MGINRIPEIKKLLGINHSDWFTVKYKEKFYECRFNTYGLCVKQEDNHPYVQVLIAPFLLMDLLAGFAIIVDDEDEEA